MFLPDFGGADLRPVGKSSRRESDALSIQEGLRCSAGMDRKADEEAIPVGMDDEDNAASVQLGAGIIV